MKNQFLQDQLNMYLAVRESLGRIPRDNRRVLQDFIEFLDEQPREAMFRAQTAVEWARGTTHTRGASAQYTFLSLARGFLTYLKSTYAEAEVPGRNLIGSWRRPTPYIFSQSDICQLMQTAAELSRQATSSDYALWHLTCECLIGLLACTGLRINEALKLLISDVQLNDGAPRVLVRESKFKKSRWVPVHPSAAEKLRDYAKARNAVHFDAADPFFISIAGTKIKYQQIFRAFRRLLRRSGIKAASVQGRPTFQGLRHTFAVTRLRVWYETGEDAGVLAPNLSVYMGHVNVAATYWYLSATPELLGGASKLFEGYSQKGGCE